MNNETKKVATSFLNAVQQGNNELLATLLSPEIKWNQPGWNKIAGMKNSSTEVFGMVGEMFRISENTLRLTEIKSVSVNKNKAACLLHWSAKTASGKILEVDNIDVYTVENGKIIAVEVYTSDQEQEDLFWVD